MATTENGVYYPNDYNSIADIPEDMKKQAESIDVIIEDIKTKQNDIENNVSKSIEQLQNENTELKSECERLKKDREATSIVEEASGEVLSLSDSSSARFNEFEISGNCEQETREGYNLIDFNVGQDKRVTINGDGTVTLNGEMPGVTMYFKKITLKKGVTYKAKAVLVSGTYTPVTSSNMGMMSPLGGGEWLVEDIFNTYTPTNDTERSSMWIGERGYI